jgi:hypothetical protein
VEALRVDVPRPAVHLDRHPLGGEREVDAVGPERIPEYPATDTRVTQQPDQQPLGGGVGAVGGGYQHAVHGRRTVPADAPAVAPVDGRKPDVALKRSIQEHRAARNDQCGLQRGERRIRHGDLATLDHIRSRQVAPAQGHAGSVLPVGRAGQRQLDRRGCAIEHAVPERRRRAGHNAARRSRPQRRCPHAGLVGESMPADQVDGGMQLAPRTPHEPGAARCRPRSHR